MRMFTKIKVNICFTHEYRAMHILGKSQLKLYLSLLGGEMLRIRPFLPKVIGKLEDVMNSDFKVS